MSDTTPTPISEISHGPSKFDVFLDKNQKKLIVLAILLLVGMVTYLVVDGLTKISAQSAGAKVTNATTAAEYAEASKNAPDNTSTTAILLMAKAQASTDIDGAIDTLKKMIADYPNSVVSEDATISLAMLQVEAGLNEEAKKTLTDISTNSSFKYTQPIAKLVLADLTLATGDLASAKELVTKASEQLKFAELEQIASMGVINAEVTAPNLIIKELDVDVTDSE